MLTRVGPNAVESSDGFRVERTRRTELRYSEGGRVAIIEVEPGATLAVYASTLRYWSSADGEESALDADQRTRILERVQKALSFLGVAYELLS